MNWKLIQSFLWSFSWRTFSLWTEIKQIKYKNLIEALVKHNFMFPSQSTGAFNSQHWLGQLRETRILYYAKNNGGKIPMNHKLTEKSRFNLTYKHLTIRNRYNMKSKIEYKTDLLVNMKLKVKRDILLTISPRNTERALWIMRIFQFISVCSLDSLEYIYKVERNNWQWLGKFSQYGNTSILYIC